MSEELFKIASHPNGHIYSYLYCIGWANIVYSILIQHSVLDLLKSISTISKYWKLTRNHLKENPFKALLLQL